MQASKKKILNMYLSKEKPKRNPDRRNTINPSLKNKLTL